MQFDWWTFALQSINFVVLVWLLRRFLYRPVQEIISKRRLVAEQVLADAEAKAESAESEKQQAEKERVALDKQRDRILQEAHESVKAEREKILKQARQDAKKIVETAQGTAAREREQALKDVKAEIADLAAEIASRMLKTVSGNDLSDAFLSRLHEEIKSLPAEELERLQGDLSKSGTSLKIATAIPLDAAARKRWSSRICTTLGIKTKPEFVVAPDLVGGAELRFPHAVLKFSWSDQVEKAKAQLVSNEQAE
jgi:F-type H+-transporting ATPase subunit b